MWSFFKHMCQQKTDLYFMTIAVMSVWKETYPDDCLGIVLSDDNDDFEVHVIEKDKSWISIIVDVFSNETEYEGASIYITATPNKEFIEAAKCKGIEKIVFIPTDLVFKQNESIKLIPFVCTFGKIIDVLSQYKPEMI